MTGKDIDLLNKIRAFEKWIKDSCPQAVVKSIVISNLPLHVVTAYPSQPVQEEITHPQPTINHIIQRTRPLANLTLESIPCEINISLDVKSPESEGKA